MENKKPNCYECIHRGTVPGDAHSCCHHPLVGKDGADMFMGMVKLLSGGLTSAIKQLNIKGNEHGIKCGWFMWPVNFDPCWLESCNGFEKQEKLK